MGNYMNKIDKRGDHNDTPDTDISRGSKLKRVISIILAWVTTIIFGFGMFLLTGLVASSSVITTDDSPDIGPWLLLSGIFGIIMLLLIILLISNKWKNVFMSHIRAGLWVGVGIYSLFVLSGAMMSANENLSSSTDNRGTCTSVEDQITKNGPALVPIATDKSNGTGFAVKSDGTLVTAYHVVEDAEHVKASFASGEVGISIVSVAPEYDLALLKMDQETPIFFDLTAKYDTMDEVLTYGYPQNTFSAGLPSVSKGIVSRVMSISDLRMTDNSVPDGLELIQTDAAANPGNSGGPLIGACGVVGVIQSQSDVSMLGRRIGIASEQGINYAISAKSVASKFNLPVYNQ